jgi:hypothetical protein
MPSLHYNPHVPGELARVILRRYGKRQIYAKPPSPSSRPMTEGMLAVRQVFTEGAAYSRAILQNPTRRAPFEAKAAAAGTQVFATIMKDFLSKPVIRAVKTDGYHGHTGDVIAVLARADLNLASVHVRLRQPDDTVIEEGDAVLASGEYRYTATHDAPAGADVFADVTVRDTDGLEVKRSVTITVPG